MSLLDGWYPTPRVRGTRYCEASRKALGDYGPVHMRFRMARERHTLEGDQVSVERSGDATLDRTSD